MKKFVNWYKKHFIIYSLLLIIGLILFFVISMFGYFLLKVFVLDDYYNKIIDKKFHNEVATIPEIKVEKFMPWEGDSIVTVNIQNKGKVSFWYGRDGIPRIEHISSYPTNFTCYYVDNKGNKTNYAYDTALVLDKNTKLYKKWFPSEVNNLHDLVTQYDSIIQALNTLPKNPKMTDFKDGWGQRSVVKNPDPNFVINIPFSATEYSLNFIPNLLFSKDLLYDKGINCDLYLRTE